MKKTAVMGFGNPVRKDDAVGCHIIDCLRKELDADNEFVTLLDMGTSAFEVLFTLQGHNRIIIVDGVINTNEPDGTLYKLPAAEVNASIQDDPMVFLHSLKWDQALSYSKKILQDKFPADDIYVYLIAISDTKLDIGMSEPVLAAARKVVDLIKADLMENA